MTAPSLPNPAQPFRRLAIYCGSSTHTHPDYLVAAADVGRALADADIGIVYGGGRVGLMGAVADAALEAGGEVIGVITEKLLALEVGHARLSERFVVPTMHQRKTKMADLADGFIALPGGLGTFEELFEVATWTQLNDHMKPCGILNIRGYYDQLLAFLEHSAQEGFIRPAHRNIISAADDLPTLLDRMAQAELPVLGTWRP